MDVFVSIASFCYEFLCGTDINIWAYSRYCYESRKQIIRNDIYWYSRFTSAVSYSVVTIAEAEDIKR